MLAEDLYLSSNHFFLFFFFSYSFFFFLFSCLAFSFSFPLAPSRPLPLPPARWVFHLHYGGRALKLARVSQSCNDRLI